MTYHAPVQLNLGCYINYMENWINLDVDPQYKADIYSDLREPLPFPNCYADTVRITHVIEHMSYREGTKLISEINRVLKPNGSLHISTPNLSFIQEHPDSKLITPEYLYGDKSTKWMYHLALYTVPMLKRLLEEQGFVKIEDEFVWHEIRLNAKKQ